MCPPWETARREALILSIFGACGKNAAGSGSVVTKDIPPNVIAAGTHCRVLGKITEDDRDYYYKDRKSDTDDY